MNEANPAERRLPTRAELDSAIAHTPTYLYRRPGRAVRDSAGAEILGDRPANFDGGYDDATGWLTGPPVRIINDVIYTLNMTDPEYRLGLLSRVLSQLDRFVTPAATEVAS